MHSIANNHIRIVTAASLFDGHDAAINIMRRILQSKGAEIIHLGHNRSVYEIVEAAIEEDAHAVAVTSYQGGHLEFFKYMKDLLDECGCGHIKIFGGGGGTILPHEIEELHTYGITRIYSPDDGRRMGLEGMIEVLLKRTKASAPRQASSPAESSPLQTSPHRGGFSSSVSFFTQHTPSVFALGKYKDIIGITKAITAAEKKIMPLFVKGKKGLNDHSYFQTSDKFYYRLLKDFADENRKKPTIAEVALWQQLRDKQLNGIKFRQQHIVVKFIADFISLEHKLIIELDGLYHQLPDMQLSDAERTTILKEHGFDVIRFTNEEVLGDIEDVKNKILSHIHHKNGSDNSIKNQNNSAQNASQVPSMGGDLGEAESESVGVVLGITGTGGAGKSSVTDEIVRRYLNTYIDKTIAVISVDPSRKKTGGALLGDRIRMNAISNPRCYMRSMATRSEDASLSGAVQDAIDICKEAGFDLVIVESAGVGQSDASILNHCDISLYVMTPEYGAATQLEKINMLDYADIICINKFDKAGAPDALQDVRKQYKRNHGLWTANNDELPVIGTVAAQFNDEGMNRLFEVLTEKLQVAYTKPARPGRVGEGLHSPIIPAKRTRYLAEIAEAIRGYDEWAREQSAIASKMYCIKTTADILQNNK